MRYYRFTLLIVLAACLALMFPQYFIQLNGFSLKKLIIPLLQVIMFGMGTTMSWRDFVVIIRTPQPVLIGLFCQFTIMPLLGTGLAWGMGFPPEIAAGIILIGCSPSGLASNVMAYIAGANVPLSITITSCATLLAPVLTPLLMKFLAGQYIAVSVPAMMGDIVMMIIMPILSGLVINQFCRSWVVRLSTILPAVSMVAIALIIMIITASGREALLQIGGWLILAVSLHNGLGYLLGYWGGRLTGLSEQDCRTIAIEVGLQNAGLASGLALQMGKEATVGLAPALFGPVMNTSGSLLASWWGQRLSQSGTTKPL